MTTHVVVIINIIFRTFYEPYMYMCVFVCVYIWEKRTKNTLIPIYIKIKM